ncbi:vancomycin resistance protein [Nocardioides seonyuensis]|uniref:Vancomycin resistance protein n=1 Tax=Nocardioides seonyuensis TaxID=2518371 RepID=A0A4P7ICC1_9ACTN|nr:VanW family protein [Nocardioides seonyuensis]QBX54173.1 vancomycin resistance protein [Nocardioides seonyuensis]
MGPSSPEAATQAQPFRVPAHLTGPPRLTQRHPRLLPLAIAVHRARRRTSWIKASLTGTTCWATTRAAEPLPHRVKQHGSLLLRELDPDRMVLQHNKVTNLRLASSHVDGLLIRPGETLSFNRVVGNCTRRQGYLDGMRLSNGSPESGVGGGICQLANLIHWMVLHSPLTVVERSEHSFDLFPDTGRVVPWGVGCSIVYNYVDLVVRNDTDLTFQLGVEVGKRFLHGQLRSDERPPRSFEVEAREEEFVRHDDRVFRRNQIWRRALDPDTGSPVGEELLKANFALVVYDLSPDTPVVDA